MITLLTSKTRSSLANAIAGSGYSLSVPKYLAWGIGAGDTQSSDIGLFYPVGSPISGTVSVITTSSSGDTFLSSTSLTSSGSYKITEVGLFDTNSSPAVGFLSSQVNPGDKTITISGYSRFPNTFPFFVQVYEEVMTVISGNGTNIFNVIRGSNGSSMLITIIPSLTPVVGPAGNMFMKSSFPSISLAPGDGVQFNISVQFI